LRCIVSASPMDSVLRLPLHYNSLVQGFVYNNLDRALAGWLHEQGLTSGKRSFRFFTFSRILGSYRIDNGTIQFSGPIKFHIGSVHQEILQSFVEHILRQPRVKLGIVPCEVTGIEVEVLPGISRPMTVKTLSPITTYSTLSTADGRKKTYYYSPFEDDWEKQILANLRRKAKALGWSETRISSLDEGHIRPVRVDNRNLRVMRYRDTVIKGWTGVYEVDLPEPFFLLVYDSGLGSKNPQGFGMVEIMSQGAR
jgi:CRISPR-associated endoribonuclease Cas6